MIFVTLGSQKFQFDRLLQQVDVLVKSNIIKEDVFAQTGCSNYVPQNYQYKPFLNRDEFSAYTERSRIVITHGGTGAIVGAVKKGKKVIAVPRLAKFGEHVDDHQLQLIEQFLELNLISVCYDLERLDECFLSLEDKHFSSYKSCTQKYIDSIDSFLKENFNLT